MAMKKTENVTDILHVAKVIRKEPTEHLCWKFSVTFQTFISPPLLTKLEQWILTDLIENIYCNFRRDLAENIQNSNTNDLSKF